MHSCGFQRLVWVGTSLLPGSQELVLYKTHSTGSAPSNSSFKFKGICSSRENKSIQSIQSSKALKNSMSAKSFVANPNCVGRKHSAAPAVKSLAMSEVIHSEHDLNFDWRPAPLTRFACGMSYDRYFLVFNAGIQWNGQLFPCERVTCCELNLSSSHTALSSGLESLLWPCEAR